MPRRQIHSQPTIVSFSGIDGAGKSTQIHDLQESLLERNMRVKVIRFWDDIACLKKIRERAGSLLFGGDAGVGIPEAPIHRRDKNVQSIAMTALRYLLYFLDAIAVYHGAKTARRAKTDVVIFDRFIYDELANLDPKSRINRIYSRLIMKFVPRPDISFILDAEPDVAHARKPEYPLEFVISNRDSFLALSALIGEMTVIAPMEVEATRQAIHRELFLAVPRLRFSPGAFCLPVEL